MTAYYCLSQIS